MNTATEAPHPAPTLLAADSWLVEDGRARELPRHRDRFTAAVTAAGGPAADVVDAFWERELRRVPTSGDWFPRAEFTQEGSLAPRLELRVRPAPQRTDEVRLWVSGRPDPRRIPRHKGPDLTVLGALRAEAVEAGATEALLTTRDGLLLEGATTSLLWWEDETLCTVDPALPTLPGVTRDWVLERAADLDVPVRRRRCRLPDLAGREVWCVNALHGIRPVTAWVGAGGLPAPGPAPRSGPWRAAWAAAAQPLPHTLDRGH
ncbi:branched-subunit amino acid aminotransferase/4-amino-4-deoxychorismate lyase [Streptomyces sp. 2333.5]|uniref:aminotransferase class IV n=1 Tax=unclassified Streptomyces TaxID=2593676 RepID=UPI00089B5C18|nr:MULTISPECIES: aminotransferase class IV [unclassified Streptomyces]PJJ05077.1 branched-subunit amino acid aminotransferase/4-amino-4-deoxychorismate lyase [Streptomyces sp. 2333.5]SEE67532.1 Branched-chain amino acid aminotransferase/4-amino-4-deoxychorismate lyase [Streptomyces sp. 2314.4]SEE93678.1 Branched-chain amino acid aminotransferase/4-amino-4-deoxychorismate lyase [Streptomyces sp. 2112.2]